MIQIPILLFVVLLSSNTGFIPTAVEFEGTETEVERELPSQLEIYMMTEIENAVLRERVAQLEIQVADLKALVLEQLNVIYQWVISR